MSTISNDDGRSPKPVGNHNWREFTEDPYFKRLWREWIAKWKRRRSPGALFDRAMYRLHQIGCDRDVVLRLAFIEFCHHPRPGKPLSKNPKKQQRLRRALEQAERHLIQAASLLRSVDTIQGLMMIPNNRIADLSDVAAKCRDERRYLMAWFCDLPTAYELFFLATYVSSFGHGQRYRDITNVLHEVYTTGKRRPPTQQKISRAVGRFRDLRTYVSKRYPEIPEDLREFPDFVENKVKRDRETMREEFLAAFPEQL